MANVLLTINMITREAIRLWKNTNSFIQHLDTQYDDQYARSGAKIGTALRIRLPADFTVRTGAAASPQDTAEVSTTLTLATQKGVDVSYSSVDRTMALDDFSKRTLAPMVNRLVGAVAVDVMTGVDNGGCSNFTANLDAAGNVLNPRAQDILNAKAILTINSAPSDNRKFVADPLTMSRMVGSLAGLLNPSTKIGSQYESGEIQQGLGFDWMEDQTVIKHTTGAYAAMTVNGAGQTGLTLTVNATSGPLVAGDIIQIAGVNAVNRITKQSTGQARQFVVTANVGTGATSIPIYPAILPFTLVNGVQTEVQYQTTDTSPANNAAITVVTPSASVYRKNLAFIPEAITLATADLELPKGVHEAAREEYDGISMRMISAYNIMTDQFITRLDVLYGFLYIRPEWVVAVGDAI